MTTPRASAWTTYAAVGDSLTEGLCDTSRQPAGRYRGWADRLALLLAGDRSRTTPLHYANLAVRSRRVHDACTVQIPRAIEFGADITSVLVGANDLVRYDADPVQLADRLAGGISLLRQARSDVLLVTIFQPRFAFLHPLRVKAAVFNECLRALADGDDGILLVDLWNLVELRQVSAWAGDRVHLSSSGHRALAYHAAETIGLAEAANLGSLDRRLHDSDEGPHPSRADQVGTAQWLRLHALPWMGRRLRGRLAGDGIVAKDWERPLVLDPGSGITALL